MDKETRTRYLEGDPETFSPEESTEAILLLREYLRRDRFLHTLYNKEEIERRVAKRREAGKPFGLFMLDIDGFKRFNDTFGHAEGDVVLRVLEVLLQTIFRREGDEALRVSLDLGRYGGDEFLLLMVEVDGHHEEDEDDRRTYNLHEQMYNIHLMLHEAIGQKLQEIEEEMLERYPEVAPVNMGISVGTAVYDPGHPVDAMTLIKQADEAMYEEKKSPR